jgi:hypothetical protein
MTESGRTLFQSPEQAIEVTFRTGQRLAILVSWLVLIGVHVAAFSIALFVLWWLQVNPNHVSVALVEWIQSKPAAVLSALGVSVVGVLGGYVGAIRWVWRKTFGTWLFSYLHKDVFPG